MTVLLPRFIVLGPIDKNDYLSYIREGRDPDGYLRFLEDQAVNPHAKFEVELSNTDGLMHIRSCQNNKYWEQTKNVSLTGSTDGQYWITATAGCYLCLWRWNNPTYTRCVLANSKVYDPNSCDVFAILDWSSLLILPSLQLGTSVIQMWHARFFLPMTETSASSRFLTKSSGGVVQIGFGHTLMTLAATTRTPCFALSKLTLRPYVFINLGNNYFCTRLTADGKTNCLNAAVGSAANVARLTVEEAVLRREIYGVNYSIENSRVYDETPLVVAKTSASNYTQEPSTLQVKLKYTDTSTRTWKTMFSLTLGMKASMEVKFPLVATGGIEISSETQSGIE
ncbi:hypothetical protein V6N13_050495 [Hibiscus sabdariffa]